MGIPRDAVHRLLTTARIAFLSKLPTVQSFHSYFHWTVRTHLYDQDVFPAVISLLSADINVLQLQFSIRLFIHWRVLTVDSDYWSKRVFLIFVLLDSSLAWTISTAKRFPILYPAWLFRAAGGRL